MACSHCSETVISAWTPQGGPSNNGRDVARRFAREILQSAVRYHREHGFGFQYLGSASGFTISADGYSRLLSALPRLDFNANVTDLREGAFASYNRGDDRVKFRPENLGRPEARGAMLHELVHAFQDLTRFRGLHVEIEATAYMAQALWVAADSGRNIQNRLRAQAGGMYSGDAADIYRQAARLCLDLGLDRAIRPIRRTDIAPLERALRNSRAYGSVVDRTYQANGIAGFRG